MSPRKSTTRSAGLRLGEFPTGLAACAALVLVAACPEAGPELPRVPPMNAVAASPGCADIGETGLLVEEWNGLDDDCNGLVDDRIPLRSGADATLTLDDTTYFGGVLVSGGDVDGDGFDDILVGRHLGFSLGVAPAVLFSGLTASGKAELTELDVMAELLTDQERATPGLGVEFFEDLDGDGRDEMLIGPVPQAGEFVGIYLGERLSGGGALTSEDLDIRFPDSTAYSASREGPFSADVDADGLGDVLWPNSEASAWRVTLGATLAPDTGSTEGDAIASLPPSRYYHVGGGVDADPGDELLLSSGPHEEGSVLMISSQVVRAGGGEDLADLVGHTISLPPGVVVQQVKGKADFDGDGRADLVLTHVRDGDGAASTVVVLSGADLVGEETALPAGVTATIGPSPDGTCSYCRADWAGDTDGDGLSDLLVIAWEAPYTRVWLFAGARLALGGQLGHFDALASWQEEEEGVPGFPAAAGDLDASGTDDLILGMLGPPVLVYFSPY